jgi:nucleotide-binding universal stress UspA family protein
MKVLVPLDGSRLSDAVLSHVRRLVHREVRAWEVHLLHVVEEKDERPETRAEARAHLAAMERILEADGLRAETRVTVDDPVHGILEHVVEEKIDLVAMATHGRTGLGRWVRGSVAERVLRGCPAPLLLVNPKGLVLKDDDVAYHRILVPVDRATDVDEGLPAVASLAGGSGASVVLLHLGGAGPALERALGLLEGRGVNYVTTIEAHGDAATVVLAAARDQRADLIALSTGPRSWLSPWPVGDVVTRVTRSAPCPVLLLRGKLARI